MSPPEGASLHDTQQIADELRTGRDALLNLARDVSESRIYRVTARPGWTLKHELAALAASDAELLHVLDELRRRPTLPAGGLDLRRRFAEAMLVVQHLRLSRIVERLEGDGATLARQIGDHAELLERPLKLVGREARSLGELAHSHVDRLRAAVSIFDEHAKR